jgi:hypothetical protein
MSDASGFGSGRCVKNTTMRQRKTQSMRTTIDSKTEENDGQKRKVNTPSLEVNPSEDIQKPSTFFSSLKSNALITSAKDLLILREKRKSDPNLRPTFSIARWSCDTRYEAYDYVLDVALKFLDECLCLEDAEGRPKSKWAIGQTLSALKMEFPEEYAEYRYLQPDFVEAPSYWSDRADYSHLWQLKHRQMEEV